MIEWLSIGYSALKDLLKFVQSKQKGLNPEETVRRCQKWKNQIKKNFEWIDDKVGYGQIIIHDVQRNGLYPEIEEKNKGISSWFRVGFLETYYRGIKVGLGIRELIYEKKYKAFRFADYKNKEEGDLNTYLVGLIPFENIVNIDWNGDEYYSCPHIYCHFLSKKKEPYEELIFCEKRWLDKTVYYSEIAKYDQVIKFSKEFKKNH